MKKSKALYIFIQDEDLKRFAVVGPIPLHSLDEWLELGIDAAKARRVKVIDVFESYLAANVQEALKRGFSQVEPDSILMLPKDRSVEYQGRLPSYAGNADRTGLFTSSVKANARF